MIINEIRWRIFLVSPAHPILFTPWDTYAFGVCDKVTQTIYINETLSPSLIKKVLCHEIVHAFMFSYEIDLSYDEEELIANVISEYGEQILKYSSLIYQSIKQK